MKKDRGLKLSRKMCAFTVGVMLGGSVLLTGCDKKENISDSQIDSEQMENEISGSSSREPEVIMTEIASYKDLIKKIADFGDAQSIAGTFCLATDDDIIYCAGWNGIETDTVTPYGPHTTYEIGPTTKEFVTVAILQLVEKGEISLDDTLESYFPDYLNGKDVTIDQLLHMNSGIPEYTTDALIDLKKRYGTEILSKCESGENNSVDIEKEILDFLYQQEVSLDGERYIGRTDSNYFLLMLILENVSGMSYEDYITKNFFEKCGMINSTVGETGHITSIPNNDMAYNSGLWYRGSSDIHSTVLDILTWDRKLMNGSLLGEEQLTYMLTPDEYGFGCGVTPNKNNGFYDDGSTGGELALNYVYVDDDGKRYYFIFQGTYINIDSMLELMNIAIEGLGIDTGRVIE